MLIEKKSHKRKVKSSFTKPEVKDNKSLAPDASRSNLVVGEKYVLKEINEIETNFLINVGMGISYAVILTFLVFKLLA